MKRQRIEITKEKLLELIAEGQNYKQMAGYFGYSDHCVRFKMQEFKIPSLRQKHFTDEQVLIIRRLMNCKTPAVIAETIESTTKKVTNRIYSERQKDKEKQKRDLNTPLHKQVLKNTGAHWYSALYG